MCVTKQIISGDVVVLPDFSAAHTTEQFLGLIRSSTVEAISFLVIDPLNLVLLAKLVPRSCFLGIQHRSFARWARKKDIAVYSDSNTAGSEFLPRSRTATITCRLPVLWRASLRSTRFSLRLAGKLYPPAIQSSVSLQADSRSRRTSSDVQSHVRFTVSATIA